MTEPFDKCEDATQRAYILGQSVGLTEAAHVVMMEAIECFKQNNKDPMANLLRALSKKLDALGDERHPEARQ